MKINLLQKVIAALAAAFVGGFSAQADPFITGEITFDGIAMLNGSLNSATAYTSIFAPTGPGDGGPVVTAAIGDYAGTVGQHADYTPFTFNPVPVSPFTLWSFSSGMTTYSLVATSVTVQQDDPGFLAINGMGIASITGFADTPATWNLTHTGVSPYFTFGGAMVAVPEPSSAALLLAFGSVALIVRRKSFKS